MPPTIIKATDHGYRKIIKICLNPDDSQYVHKDGSPHPATNIDGCVNDPPGSGFCQYNWEVREFTWTDKEMYKTNSEGQPKLKTSTELIAEMKQTLADEAAAALSPTSIPDLEGIEV